MRELQLVILAAGLAGAMSAKAQSYFYTLTPNPTNSYLTENGSSTVITYSLHNSIGSVGDIWVYSILKNPQVYTILGDPSDVANFGGSTFFGNPATQNEIDVAPGATVPVAQFVYRADNDPPEIPPEAPGDHGTYTYLPPALGLATTIAGINGTQVFGWDGDLSKINNFTISETVGNADFVLYGILIDVQDVPEPSTLVLLLLPFGAATLRILRKNRTG